MESGSRLGVQWQARGCRAGGREGRVTGLLVRVSSPLRPAWLTLVPREKQMSKGKENARPGVGSWGKRAGSRGVGRCGQE